MKRLHNRETLRRPPDTTGHSEHPAVQPAAAVGRGHPCRADRTLRQNDRSQADTGFFGNLFSGRAALLLLFIAAALCLAQRPLSAERRYVGTIVAVVNDVIISEDDVKRRAAAAIHDAVQKYKGVELRSKVNKILEDVLQELIDRQLLVQKAHSIIKDNPYVQEQIEKDLNNFLKDAVDEVGSLSKFYEIAIKEGINPSEKKKELRDDLMVERLLNEFVYMKINITPKDIREYYQEHRDEFTQKRSVRIRQIMLKFSSYPSREEAEKKAEEIRQRAVKGEDFGALAKEFSEGPRAPEGGLWDFDDVLSMRGRLQEAALALEKGQISGIISTTASLHIFKAEDVRPAARPDFEALQGKIKNILFKQEAAKRKREYVRGLKKNAVINIVKLKPETRKGYSPWAP